MIRWVQRPGRVPPVGTLVGAEVSLLDSWVVRRWFVCSSFRGTRSRPWAVETAPVTCSTYCREVQPWKLGLVARSPVTVHRSQTANDGQSTR
jgi:hypothetical protein